MTLYGQIRRDRLRLIKDYDSPPAIGDWVCLTEYDPLPEVGDVYSDGSFSEYEPVIELGVLAHDKWAIAADDTEVVTVTYTANEAVCFVVNDEIHVVEPTDQVATLEITADASGPIRIDVRGQSIVLAATEVSE